MGETKTKKPESRPSLSFVFVHSHDEHKQSRVIQQSATWWSRFKMWVEYYTIQWRWDIERRLARLFNRRWGG